MDGQRVALAAHLMKRAQEAADRAEGVADCRDGPARRGRHPGQGRRPAPR
jgi:hypothetical protein